LNVLLDLSVGDETSYEAWLSRVAPERQGELF
jgi:hypothetical protein